MGEDCNKKRSITKFFLTNASVGLDGAELIPIDFGGNLTTPACSVNELGKQLLQAAAEGNVDELRHLMSKGAPFTADWLGTSPLHLAAQNNKIEIVEILLRAGISRDARTKVDRTPLHLAAYEGHVEIVEILLKSGANCDSRDLLHMTPLHWAAQNGHSDVVSTLIYYGACTNLVNKFNLTASDISAQIKRQDIVDIINSNSCNLAFNKQHVCVNIANDTNCLGGNEGLISRASVIPLETILKEDSSDNSITSDTLYLNTESEINIQKEQNEQIDNSLSESVKILRQHGITMLPLDDNNILHSVVENGHSVVLTEIGKEVLNSVKPYDEQEADIPIISKNIKGNDAKKDKYNDEFLSTDGFSSPENTLKQVNDKIKNLPNSAVQKIVMKKNKLKVSCVPQKISIKQKNTTGSTDMETVMKQLIEARKLIEEYKQKLTSKEVEIEEYKRQLQLLKQTNNIV